MGSTIYDQVPQALEPLFVRVLPLVKVHNCKEERGVALANTA